MHEQPKPSIPVVAPAPELELSADDAVVVPSVVPSVVLVDSVGPVSSVVLVASVVLEDALELDSSAEPDAGDGSVAQALAKRARQADTEDLVEAITQGK